MAVLIVLPLIILQFIAYYAVYIEHGIISIATIGEIFIMTMFPPYAWYTVAKFFNLF